MLLDFLILLAVFIVMVIGLIGEILPGVPGMILIWSSALAYALYQGFDVVSIYTILLLIFIWGVASGISYLITYLTAKHLQVSWAGIIGAFLGSAIGLIFSNLIGMLIGMCLGAFAGEYYQQRKTLSALQASGAMILGFALGSALKIILAILMILIFIVALIW